MVKSCAVCGKPSGMYPLCPACFKLRDDGKIEKCEKCGVWHLKSEPCGCKVEASSTTSKLKRFFNDIINPETTPSSSEKGKNQTDKESEKEKDKSGSATFSKCITCGKKTAPDYLFCSECYHKYKDKELHIKICHCTEIELLEDSYEGRYTCKDGHVVKSKSELLIDNYLFEHAIPHAYEKALPIDEDEKHDLHPDFYLPNFGGEGKHVYIEYWGFNEDNIQYTKTKKYKLSVYQKMGITLICTNEKNDMKDIDAALDRKLKHYEIGKVNFDS